MCTTCTLKTIKHCRVKKGVYINGGKTMLIHEDQMPFKHQFPQIYRFIVNWVKILAGYFFGNWRFKIFSKYENDIEE